MAKKRVLLPSLALSLLTLVPQNINANISSNIRDEADNSRAIYLSEHWEGNRGYLYFSPKKKTPSLEAAFVTNDFSKDSESVLLARMLLGEAEGCSTLEKVAIAYTALNRVNDGKRWNGETLKEALLTPGQYSCFNHDNKRSKVLKNPLRYNAKEFLQCVDIAEKFVKGKYNNISKGATHYYNPRGISTPYWARHMKEIGKIGDSIHLFYKEL